MMLIHQLVDLSPTAVLRAVLERGLLSTTFPPAPQGSTPVALLFHRQSLRTVEPTCQGATAGFLN